MITRCSIHRNHCNDITKPLRIRVANIHYKKYNSFQEHVYYNAQAKYNNSTKPAIKRQLHISLVTPPITHLCHLRMITYELFRLTYALRRQCIAIMTSSRRNNNQRATFTLRKKGRGSNVLNKLIIIPLRSLSIP